MKTKTGNLLMLLGVLMILGAIGLLFYNHQEQAQAARSVDALMPQLVEAIREVKESPAPAEPGEPAETAPAQLPDELPAEREMPVAEIDGHSYIGFVGIEALELELPVMADWSYPKLRIAPCRFTGSTYADDLVIMAHNYDRHFGKLRQLKAGEAVTFTDMEGRTLYYEVVALDILGPNAVEDMTAGEYDLTLFTCTYGGKSRVTIRCDRIVR